MKPGLNFNSLIDESLSIRIPPSVGKQLIKDLEAARLAAARIGSATSFVGSYFSQIFPLMDIAQARFLKLPRRQKKAYIKRHGRTAYRKKYHAPGIVLMINSPGGMVC